MSPHWRTFASYIIAKSQEGGPAASRSAYYAVSNNAHKGSNNIALINLLQKNVLSISMDHNLYDVWLLVKKY